MGAQNLNSPMAKHNNFLTELGHVAIAKLNVQPLRHALRLLAILLLCCTALSLHAYDFEGGGFTTI